MNRYFVKAWVLFFAPERGGRPFMPVGDGYAPYLRDTEEGRELAVRINGMPTDGDFEQRYTVEIELSYHPRIDYSSIRKGEAFDMIEGPKTVGKASISSEIYARDLSR